MKSPKPEFIKIGKFFGMTELLIPPRTRTSMGDQLKFLSQHSSIITNDGSYSSPVTLYSTSNGYLFRSELIKYPIRVLLCSIFMIFLYITFNFCVVHYTTDESNISYFWAGFEKVEVYNNNYGISNSLPVLDIKATESLEQLRNIWVYAYMIASLIFIPIMSKAKIYRWMVDKMLGINMRKIYHQFIYPDEELESMNPTQLASIIYGEIQYDGKPDILLIKRLIAHGADLNFHDPILGNSLIRSAILNKKNSIINLIARESGGVSILDGKSSWHTIGRLK